MARVRRPVRVSGALALGLGALVAGEARADRPTSVGAPQPAPSEVVLRTEGERIYISERGDAFRELLLGGTREAAVLRGLLKQAGAERVTVPVGSIVVANGGGNVGGVKPKASTDESAAAKKGKSKRKRATQTHG
jgi:hypothetical protein